MDLLEYQAKELFQQVGIPILPSQPIKSVGELKWLQIPYPIVLKSQVRTGGRGKAGGIRFVENTIDAIAAANSIFNLSINGEYPDVILAEAKYKVTEELFLAILLDYQLQRPVLLGSARGGIEVEILLENMHKVVIEEDFSPFYARRLAIKMGLEGELIRTISEIIEKMYLLLLEKDLDIIEINPLALNADGEVMALDGKMTVNDTALLRHPDLMTLTQIESQPLTPVILQTATPLKIEAPKSKRKGNIAIIANSQGLSFSAWDQIVQEKGLPDCCYILNEYEHFADLQRPLTEILNALSQNKEIKVILMNWLANPQLNNDLSQCIGDFLLAKKPQSSDIEAEDRMIRPTSVNRTHRGKKPLNTPQKSDSANFPALILRIVGEVPEGLPEKLASSSVIWADNLEKAANEAVKLAKVV